MLKTIIDSNTKKEVKLSSRDTPQGVTCHVESALCGIIIHNLGRMKGKQLALARCHYKRASQIKEYRWVSGYHVGLLVSVPHLMQINATAVKSSVYSAENDLEEV